MGNKEQDSSQELLTCFFAECETQFRFLELKHDYHYFSGLVHYSDGRQVITPYKNQSIDGVFWAATRYEKDESVFEIIFGDKDFSLEGYACFDRINRFGFEQIMDAAKKPNADIGGGRQIYSAEEVQETLQDIAQPFKNHLQYFTRPSPKLIERALNMRGKRMQHQIYERYKSMVEDASAKAAKAFLEKDYGAVVELLLPFERDLSASDRKKLEKARAKCKESI